MEPDSCNKEDRKCDPSCKQPLKNTVSRAIVYILSSVTVTQLYHCLFQNVFFCCFFFFQELHPDEIDTDSAYILFYEQQGVDYAQFLPKIDGKKMADTSSMDEDFESDYKKYCVLQ